jgi:hypothetical protein
MNQSDLQALKGPLLVLLVVLLAGAAAVYYSDRMVKEARQQLTQQQLLLKDARTRLQKSGEEKDVIVKYLDSFRQLQSAGIIGEEQRINWLDGLRLANQQADIFGVDYQIGTQTPYNYAGDFSSGQLTLNQSIMKLQFRLLHEEDLMRFLGALGRQGGGLFTIDQCAMKRIDTGGVIRFQPNLAANCQLSWVTLKVGASAEPRKP